MRDFCNLTGFVLDGFALCIIDIVLALVATDSCRPSFTVLVLCNMMEWKGSQLRTPERNKIRTSSA
jgi:hypothetical protein